MIHIFIFARAFISGMVRIEKKRSGFLILLTGGHYIVGERMKAGKTNVEKALASERTF